MDTQRLDALVAPTTRPAWKIDLVNGDGISPGSSRAWSEATLIKLAYAFEQASKAHHPPQYPATTL
jgi:amidase